MIFTQKKKEGSQKGFTLLELLIVIAIIAILSVILVLVINPAETLKKSRDAQRISDMNTIKTALGLLLMSSSTPNLAQTSTDCLGASGGSAKIFYSYAGPVAMACTAAPIGGADAEGNYAAAFCVNKTSSAAASAVDGTGWLPVDLSWLPGGSPISNFPLDPINTVANANAPTSTDLVYRYACKNAATAKPTNVFEIDARLESDAYTVTDNKMTKDGGDNSNFYEVGTNLKLLPTSGGF